MAKRKSLSKKTRFDVFKRDGFQCQYCGSHPPNVLLHVDHVIPVCDGGSDDQDNLVTACEGCNLGKGPRSLTAIPESLSDKATRIQEQEEQLRGYSEIMQARRERIEDDTWEVADIFIERFNKEGIRRDWFASIKTFNQKLGKFEVLEAMDLAVDRGLYSEKRTFAYFCGICWNKLRELENG